MNNQAFSFRIKDFSALNDLVFLFSQFKRNIIEKSVQIVQLKTKICNE